MDFHLLSDVRDQDGTKLGELRHIVFDPEARRVVSLVIQQAELSGHAVVVPIDTVVSADDDAVYLNLSPDEVKQLEPYAVAENIAPPPADIYPGTESSDQLQEPIDIPDVAPVGAADGITTIAYTPIVEVSRNIPDGTVVIDDGTVVRATDGELGKVERILVDDTTGDVTALVVEHGFVFIHALEIPVDRIASVDQDGIRINVSKADVERSGSE